MRRPIRSTLMPPTLREVLDWKLVRYGAASVAGVVTSQIVLLGCLVVLDLRPVPSNIAAVTIGAIPNYLINRAWTFNKRGSHSFTREVLPFWGMAFLGLVLSTLVVAAVEARWGDAPLLISAANIGSFGVLWVAKFFVLDRVLFAPLVEFVEEHEDDEGHLHLHAVDHDHD